MQKINCLTSAQTIAKYKNLRCYYALTYLTALQTQKLYAFFNNLLHTNFLQLDACALTNLRNVMQANALPKNCATVNVTTYSNLLLQHDTCIREKINAAFYKQHKALYVKMHKHINVSLIDMY